MTKEKKNGFFARLGFGQSNNDGCGCCCSSVEIVPEGKVTQQEGNKDQQSNNRKAEEKE